MESINALMLAVVGHTNTGKTSLMRTLLHDSQFGEVDSRPSTTREVTSIDVEADGQTLIRLFDTPGLEAGSDLYEHLVQSESNFRHDGPAQVRHFLNTMAAGHEFEQESKVLRQLLKCHAALYVIDVRDPVLPKYQDELSVLARCGKPILPILNFTGQKPNHVNQWKLALTKVNLHAHIEFDAVSPPDGGESILFNRLSAIVPGFHQQLEQLAQYRQQQREQRLDTGLTQIAELLVDVAAFHEHIKPNTEDAQLKPIIESMQNLVKRRERNCVTEMLALYAFRLEHVRLQQLRLNDGQWKDDLFEIDTLKEFGIKAGVGLGSGAAIGAGFDLMVGGASLGAGTAIGAAIGGAWQGWTHYGKKLVGHLKGERELIVDDEILKLLTLRQMNLLQQLATRGHGSQALLMVTQSSKLREQFLRALSTRLKLARRNPQWSSLNQRSFVRDAQRQACVSDVTELCRGFWSQS
ncbi:DUF3482 domain-containing protein [Pseudidiomarina gelatinasegens]|uniref:DUF3482 domain-containing protein n=1 Tax=Pseudidiomarina gelatinasegens TaxID=2487740 RepID=A0A443Z5P2_9GAMM|nr:GTPase/DUF3482 domain-containing protein [Pseudidiomarina gelatinasegens]RWU12116.1 DUF3482 domain-containing protein [Pseudidiomarina gelatinasegens]|tara:strand:- start:2115 stop:3512 length:1398 start_codon:yes stop_codon:yes gene_type:complete